MVAPRAREDSSYPFGKHRGDTSLILTGWLVFVETDIPLCSGAASGGDVSAGPELRDGPLMDPPLSFHFPALSSKGQEWIDMWVPSS